MSREAKSGLVTIALCLIFAYIVVAMNVEDKYVMRDGCVYHKTTEVAGDDFTTNYTLVTCDKEEFHKYDIED